MLGKLGILALEVEPQLHESQSNGAVKNGVKLFIGMLTVHLLAFERKLGHHIPSKHPLVTWLVEHVADIIIQYLRGSDARTAYKRLFGKQIHEEALSLENVYFGEHARAST